MMRPRSRVVLVLLAAGAGVALLLDGVRGFATFGLAWLILPTLAGLLSLLVALAANVQVVKIAVGDGEAVVDHRGARLFFSLGSFPVGLSWAGYARSRRFVRTRFFLPSLAEVLTLGAVALAGFAIWDAPGIGCAAAVELMTAALPQMDASGRNGALRQVFTIPRTQEHSIIDWYWSPLARRADRALWQGEYALALEVAQRALAENPGDRHALAILAAACDRLGDPLRAVGAAERLIVGGDRSSQISTHANLAWYLVRAREAGHEPEQWRNRAVSALDVAEEDGGRWELLHIQCLLDVLSGHTETSERLLPWIETQVLAPESVAQLHLTRAHMHRLLGDMPMAAREIAKAEELMPNHARVRDVRRWLST